MQQDNGVTAFVDSLRGNDVIRTPFRPRQTNGQNHCQRENADGCSPAAGGSVGFGPVDQLTWCSAFVAGVSDVDVYSLPSSPLSILTSMSQTIELSNGTLVTIRPISPGDQALEREFIHGLSDKTRYLRIMGHVKELTPQALDRLTNIDPERETALVATISTATGERQVGVARYSLLDTPGSCEFAIVVADDWQGAGLGKALMLALIDSARQRGLSSMIGTTLPENRKMKRLADSLGFEIGPDPSDPHLVLLRLEL